MVRKNELFSPQFLGWCPVYLGNYIRGGPVALPSFSSLFKKENSELTQLFEKTTAGASHKNHLPQWLNFLSLFSPTVQLS